MKLRQRIALLAGVLGLGTFTAVDKSDAQIWATFDVGIENIFYNPLAGGQLIPDNAFLSFVGSPDPDDGVANNIPVGFDFEYNRNMYSTVNAAVNGWVSVGQRVTPVITNDNAYLFLANEPNNTVAPFWGDHFYRTLEPGYRPSRISYLTTYVPDPNPNATPGATIGTFTLEWRDLNINDKTNPNSIASFQVKFIQNAMANDQSNPDERVTIQFHYGSIGGVGQVTTEGASVGIEDSIGFTHLNGLFQSSFNDEQDARLNTTERTSCWPPATCNPGRAIVFSPEGRASSDQWGDGDVNLTQVFDTSAYVRRTQSRFVTLADALMLLESRAQAYPPLDSTEGRNAFHGDANHNGQYQNPNFPGINLYRVTAYDAAYILLYLAAKLPVLPWPEPLPVPAYKGSEGSANAVSGLVADAAGVRVTGSTLRLPIVLRGSVNGAFSVEMDVKSVNTNVLTFAGTRSTGEGSLMSSNGATGRVVLASAGKFNDGDVVGYLEFNVVADGVAEVALENVTVNDEPMGAYSTRFPTGVASVDGTSRGYALEQNTPNPFNMGSVSATEIRFSLGAQESVTLRVFDVLGNEVRTLASGETFIAGPNSVKWDGRDNAGNVVANGFYYYQISTASFVEAVKMQVIR